MVARDANVAPDDGLGVAILVQDPDPRARVRQEDTRMLPGVALLRVSTVHKRCDGCAAREARRAFDGYAFFPIDRPYSNEARHLHLDQRDALGIAYLRLTNQRRCVRQYKWHFISPRRSIAARVHSDFDVTGQPCA